MGVGCCVCIPVSGLFVSSPLPEYTISVGYSSDRLRGALPLGSPRRPAIADCDVPLFPLLSTEMLVLWRNTDV